MKHFKIIILIILFLFNHKIYAGENIVEILKKNDNIIFIRHSLAPGSGDPENINLNDCKTQRNLNSEGIKQSKKIGNFFKKNNIKIEHIEKFLPDNLGKFKGMGEGGTIGSVAAIANAVSNAISHLNIEITELPISRDKLYNLIKSGAK